MTRGHDAVRLLARQSKSSISISTTPPLCLTCLSTLHFRLTHTQASPLETAPIEPSPSGRAPPALTSTTSPSTRYLLKASILLSRPPLLTRSLTPFEKSHFLYQKRLNERLVLPFTRYFYYQRGTPEEAEWKRKMKERKTAARDIGVYNAYGEEGWNDEVLVGERIAEPEEQVEALLRDAEKEGREGAETEGAVVKREVVERPMPRVTEADRGGDARSLNRMLERTLYLVVKGGEGLMGEEAGWRFPTALLEKSKHESLHTAAERIIVQTGGVNMNTWVVGNMPIGHNVYNYKHPIVNKQYGFELRGEKVFFMKARILAGQANLTNNKFGYEDFQWLSKEELQRTFSARDWNAVKTILPER